MRATLASLLAVLLLPHLSPQAALGEAFRWVDENGGVHYGDSPSEGAVTGSVTTLDVYECNTPECVQMESLRAEQARANVRALEEAFPRTTVAPTAASRAATQSYVNTIVREVYVSPFAVPVQGFHRPVPFVKHRSHRGGNFVASGGRRHSGGNSNTRTMSMPRY